jgi:integrase/recombinase XerD
MKTDRHGQAKILSADEIQRLFETGFTCDRDHALFGICLYTACRINEACTLLTTDVYDANGVRAKITIRKGNTKGQQDTRQVATHPALAAYLSAYQGQGDEHLFPGRHRRGHLHPTSADAILRNACQRVGLEGVSTHSMRRTALTVMHCAGIPLGVLQKISGHRNLQALQKYLEISEEQVEVAISALTFI